MIINLCGNCGKVINEDYIFCPYCGKLIGESDNKVVEVTVPAGVTGIKIAAGSGEQSDVTSCSHVKGSRGHDGVDEVYIEALRYVAERRIASVSMIQRGFPIGYVKSCKIIDWMENMGYIGPFIEGKARKVLITPEEVKEIFG